MTLRFSTSDPDEFVGHVQSRCAWDMRIGRRGRFSSTIASVATARILGVSSIHEGEAEFVCRKGPANLGFLLVDAGGLDIGVAGHRHRLTKGDVGVYSEDRIETLRFVGRCSSRHLTIPTRVLQDHASAMLGPDTHVPETMLDIRGQEGGGAVLGEMYSHLEMADRTIQDPRLRKITFHRLEEVILSAVVTYLSSSGLLTRRPAGPALPTHLKRALDIANTMTQPLSVVQLAEASGVSVRTLQLVFQAELGQRPHDHLKTIRLQRLRQAVESMSGDRFAEVALHWGFANITRLKAEYTQAFGSEAWERIEEKRRTKT